MRDVEIEQLASRIRAGETRAISRGLTLVEAGGAHGEALSEALYSDAGHAHIVGITGAPGAGKSTLVSTLTRAARAQHLAVAIIAVDPSSPFSGGSILGDRIRMNDLSSDKDVFIRSMASRGAMGGLCRAAAEAVDLFRAAGRDLIILETVGVGQDEVDVMRLAHSTVVVHVPGLGDEIQAMKAGIIEIADIHVVNKADREGADRTIGELRSTLSSSLPRSDGWQTPIIPCVATREEGSAALLNALGDHLAYLNASGEFDRRERRIVESRVLKLAQELLAHTLNRPIEDHRDATRRALERVARRDVSPRAGARALLAMTLEAERTSHV